MINNLFNKMYNQIQDKVILVINKATIVKFKVNILDLVE